MPRFIRAVIAFAILLAGATAFGQSQNVEMRVTVTWADGRRLGADEGNAPGLPDSAGKTGSATGEHVSGNAVTNMDIRVMLLNDDGSTIAETSPDSEGTVKFLVIGVVMNSATGARSYPSYRLRVRGAAIEETFVDNLQPGLADRMVTVELHRKGEKKAGGGGLVSAAALKIPRKAEKEFARGQKELAKNKLTDAKATFQRAVEIYPKYDTAYNSLGFVLFKLGDTAGAKRAFEQAVAANDKYAPAYVNLARLLAMDKKYDEAAGSLSRSLALEPLNPEALSLLCQYDVIRGKYDDVPGLAMKMHSVPHDGQALGHYAAGNALEHLNRPTDAIFEYMLFMKEDPTSKLSANAKQEVDRLQQLVGQANHPQ